MLIRSKAVYSEAEVTLQTLLLLSAPEYMALEIVAALAISFERPPLINFLFNSHYSGFKKNLRVFV